MEEENIHTLLDHIKGQLLTYNIAWAEAQAHVPIAHDEYYESDQFYYGATTALREVLQNYGRL